MFAQLCNFAVQKSLAYGGHVMLRGITSQYAYQKQALLCVGIHKGIADALNAASEREVDENFHNDVLEKIIAYVIGSM